MQIPLPAVRRIIIGCLTIFAAMVMTPFISDAHAAQEYDEVYIQIPRSQLQLSEVFNLIKAQTGYTFAYDESDIDLKKQVKLETGQQLLSKTLQSISRQAGVTFTSLRNKILVQPAKTLTVQKDQVLNIPSRVITGTVKDENNQPMANVTVTVKNKTTAVQTDGEGKFSINAEPGEILVFSIVGYKQMEITVGQRNTIDVSLTIENKGLSEVVIVGYQPQRRADLAGAVSSVDPEGVSRIPVATLDQALQGKAAGVRITQSTGQPGEGVAVRIRGVGTINDNNPLFIIDGIPTKDGINFLATSDIESIVVLKDASSAAIYGARAANGVVLVTTKSGKKGKVQFNYAGYGGIQTHGKLPKMANTAQYVELYNEAVDNDNMEISNPTLKRKYIPDSIQMANTDWLDAIFRNGPIMSHQLSVGGGNDKSQYYVSGNYFRQDGIILNSWFERYSLLAKINADLTPNLKLGNNITLSYTRKNIIGSSGDGYGGNGGSVVRYALFRTPPIPIYDGDGNFTDLPAYPNFFGDGYNPVALAEKTDNKEKQYRVFGNLFLEYKVAPEVRIKSDVGLDFIVNDDKRFDENYGTNLRINSPSRLASSAADNLNLIWNNTIRFNKTIAGKHSLNAVAGTEAISNRVTVQGGSDSKFQDQIPSLRYLGLGLNITKNVFESEQEWALFSLFGNVSYTYDNRFLASVNVRRDGSSRFSEKNKYGTFYSGSLGWNLHNEKWLKDHLKDISKLRLRASFGQLGSQDIGNYPWASIVGRGYNYVFGSSPVSVPGYTITTRGNENVKWESSTQANAGVDIGMFSEHLNLTVDYYVKRTSDMLIPIPLPLIGGSASTPYVNAGKVENRGLEVEAHWSNTDHALKYDIGVNFSTLHNEVLSLASGEPIPGGRIDNGIYATLTTVGQPIGAFYLYQMDGIFQNDAEIIRSAYQGNGIRPGDVKFKDVNGDGYINEKDRTFLGSAIPKYIFGATANLSFKNFDLSVFFQGQYGNKLYLQVNHDIEGFYRAFNLTERVYDERWHGEGTSNTMPRVSWLGSSNNKTPSSRFLEDGSYVRLKNVQLGYTFPLKLLQSWSAKNLRIYFTGQNLLTFTKYTGLDPEMHTSDNLNSETYRGDVAAGIDWGTYPSAKSYIIGVNLNF